MKAVVVELKDNYAAVLSDDGCVVTIKNNGYVIGQVIQIGKPRVEFSRKIIAFAASAAAFVVFGVSSWAYASPYTYVSLDVNPSIEYTVNRFDRVLTVKAVNDDGEEILKEISLENLKNKTIADALTNTIEQISEAGYFDGASEGGIIIATSGKNREKAEQLASYLQETVETEVTENGDNVEIEAFSVGLDRVEEARELGVTPGKLNLVEKLQDSASDPASIDTEEWLNKSVKDIMDATKENKKSEIVSGSALSIKEKESEQDTNDADKSSVKEEKLQKEEEKLQKKEEKLQKEEEELQKKEEKAAEKDNKALERETKQAEKPAENAAADEENSSSKTKEKARKTKEQVTVAEEKAVSETPEQPPTTEEDVTDNIDKNVKKENSEPTVVPSEELKKNEKSEIKSQTEKETSTGQEDESTDSQIDNAATGTNVNKNSTGGGSDNSSVNTNEDNSGSSSESTGSNSSNSNSNSNSDSSGGSNSNSNSDNSGGSNGNNAKN